MKQLSEKLIRAERKNQGEIAEKINYLKGTLFPSGSLQERHNNFSELYLSEGNGLVDKLLDLFELPEKTILFN